MIDNIQDELNSIEYKKEWTRFIEMKRSVIYCLHFCYLNSVRDGVSGEKNFFLRMIDDILQSVVSIELLAKEGITNICRRELRYLIELVIKSNLIVTNTKKQNLIDQVKEYEELLNSSNINPINTLSLDYFEIEIQNEFKSFVKRTYGYLSKYTHSSSFQIRERLEKAESGRTIGYEGSNELKELNDDIEKVFLSVLVFIFHSVEQYVVGDYFVEPNGESVRWYFDKSKFINLIDARYYALAKANDKVYTPEILSNGDTHKQLLVRSRYLLFKHHSKWTESQKHRAEILFDKYPEIKDAYNLSIKLGDIFKNVKSKDVAFKKLALWYNEVEAAGIESFRTVSRSVQTHYLNIINFFNNRSTNASAESFNAKIKAFRATSRGVRDINFFLFRLSKIYA